MAALSPPPMRHRASSTNLRPALTISTLGPRPKSCALLDAIPPTPPVTTDFCKASQPLAYSSRLPTLLNRCWQLLHVHPYLPPYSTSTSPRSPSEDSVLPMSSTTTFEDSIEEKRSVLNDFTPSHYGWRSAPSVSL
jgi:hypothetical protein